MVRCLGWDGDRRYLCVCLVSLRRCDGNGRGGRCASPRRPVGKRVARTPVPYCEVRGLVWIGVERTISPCPPPPPHRSPLPPPAPCLAQSILSLHRCGARKKKKETQGRLAAPCRECGGNNPWIAGQPDACVWCRQLSLAGGGGEGRRGTPSSSLTIFDEWISCSANISCHLL